MPYPTPQASEASQVRFAPVSAAAPPTRRSPPAETAILAQPPSERPREKLLAQGAAALATPDLLALLINSGRPGESALDAGRKLHRRLHDRLGDLAQLGPAELRELSIAVGPAAYCRIMAGVELGRRVAEALDHAEPEVLGGADAARRYCARRFARLAREARQEEFHIVTCDTRHAALDTHLITRGVLDSSLVHPREVFRPAIRDAAASVVLVHNHPSGDPTPSVADYAVTARLLEVGRVIGIHVLDHIIVGEDAVSLRQLNGGAAEGVQW